MRVLITGANGMLGTAIANQLSDECDLFAFSSRELDITCPSRLEAVVRKVKPKYIINCAAYTAVDQAETEESKSFSVNATGVRALAQVSTQYDVTLIHFSTDYVFDGKSNKPYQPNDPVNPINIYGESKLFGEKAILATHCKYYIFRISWLYAAHGKNFFKWVAESEQRNLKIVDSQVGSPTSALDVAEFVNVLLNNDPKQYSIYHFTNKGSLTWYDFAKMINTKLELGKDIAAIDHFKTAAKRPAFSVLDTLYTEDTFNFQIPSIESGLDRVIKSYN